MKRIAILAYGIACHALFLVTFLYMMAFTGNLGVPVGIDAEGALFGWRAAAVDALLVALFALQHSVMARPGFKRWWTRWVPQEIERSTYVLVSCVVVVALMAFWQPIGPNVWDVRQPVARGALWGLFAAGWLMVPLVSLLINHFDLFGTRQVWLRFTGRAYTHLPFRTPGVYRFVRHPLYVGWMLAFWATPTMSVGHLLYAGLMSAYMLAAIPIEERDLIGIHGEQYRSYRERVPALIPRLATLAATEGRVTT